jgi:hypothetical protein
MKAPGRLSKSFETFTESKKTNQAMNYFKAQELMERIKQFQLQ